MKWIRDRLVSPRSPWIKIYEQEDYFFLWISLYFSGWFCRYLWSRSSWVMARSPIVGRCEGRSPSVAVKPHLHRYCTAFDTACLPFLPMRGSLARRAIAMCWFIGIKAIAINQHRKQIGFDLFGAGIIVGLKVLKPSFWPYLHTKFYKLSVLQVGAARLVWCIRGHNA